jgi:hypothetical protein
MIPRVVVLDVSEAAIRADHTVLLGPPIPCQDGLRAHLAADAGPLLSKGLEIKLESSFH